LTSPSTKILVQDNKRFKGEEMAGRIWREKETKTSGGDRAEPVKD
jgi:hypothetical protein